MSIKDRAKQFMPFSALKGYEHMLEEKLFRKDEKKEISDEQALYLTKKLQELKKRDIVKVVYYEDGYYVTKEGIVSAIDYVLKVLTVVKTKINFEDICELYWYLNKNII